jgi:putative hydrolase of the HAD superfamily
VLAQRSKIEHLGWEELFDTCLVTGELPAGKPNAAAFEALLEGLGTDAGETVYIGDTPVDDIEGATESGLYAIQVLFDGGPDRDPRADAYIDRDRLTMDLPAVLDSLG